MNGPCVPTQPGSKTRGPPAACTPQRGVPVGCCKRPDRVYARKVLDIDGRGLEAFIALADSLDELVFVWKTNGDMLWTNRAFVHETGMTVEDFGFQNTDNPFVHPEDLPHVLAELGAFIDSDAVRSAPIENRFFDA